MILTDFSQMRVYLKLGITDMRKSINTLSILVQEEMKLDVFSPGLFVFCNRRCDIIKILYWDNNGFALWQKRLEKHKFKWPKDEKDIFEIDHNQLGWLLSGLDITAAHEKLKFSLVS